MVMAIRKLILKSNESRTKGQECELTRIYLVDGIVFALRMKTGFTGATAAATVTLRP